MSVMVHEGEGVLFVNEGETYRGAIMVGGITYDIVGTAATGRNAIKYIRLAARERKAPSLAPPAKLPGRSQRVQEALDRLTKDYRR